MEPSQLLQVALTAARDAVAVQRRYLGTVRVEDWSEKGVSDFVTHVDREAEDVIVERIRAAFPGHAILAEEAATATGTGLPDSEWLWLVDPLDGTTNYLHGYPAYSASVAVAHRGELLAGAVVHGSTGEEWTATRGGGARKDGRPVHVSSVDRLRLALVGTGFPFKRLELLPRYLAQFAAVLRHSAGVRRAGSAALDLCHLATGYLDGFWELVLAPWDVAAGSLIVREAGGLVTDPAGRTLDLGGGSVVAGNAPLHAQLLELLDRTETPRGATG
jgi:myo-inositol-1(or 4)-monophosphatase